MKLSCRRVIFAGLFTVLALLLLSMAAASSFASSCPPAFRAEGTISEGDPVLLETGEGDAEQVLIACGASCTVIGAESGMYRILYDGRTGLVPGDRVIVTGSPEDAAITDAASDSLILEDYLPFQEGSVFYLPLSGEVHAPFAVDSLCLFVWDERSLSLERAVFVPLKQPADTVDASVLKDHLPLGRMKGGRKTLVIQGYAQGEPFVLARLFIVVRGEANEPAHITDLCEGLPEALTDASVFSVWMPDETVDCVEFRIPEGLDAQLMTLEWELPPDSFTVTQTDRNGTVLSETTRATGFFADSVELDADAASVRIVASGDFISMCTLRVYPEQYAAYAVQRWEPLPEKVDLMLFCTHQDDDLLFFGGMIPYYNDIGKTVAVTYLTDCGRHRYREALDGLWITGLKYHPVFLGWPNGVDERIISLTSALGYWQDMVGDPVLELVRLLRKYRPEVVASHDFDGEYWHGQHELTARLVAEAVTLAADPAYDPDGGDPPWEVKKTYFHLYTENRIFMDWNRPLEGETFWTPMMLAKEAYDQHRSQTDLFTMEYDGVKYDNTCFGLYATAVGEDEAKNDLFEHIP